MQNMTEDEISDPSDWLNTAFPPLFELDSMVRCHICKDFLTAPVVTQCGHCFCSLCIRKTIMSIRKCPLCNEEILESKLRKILLLDEISGWFTKVRRDLMYLVRKQEEPELIELEPEEPEEPQQPQEPAPKRHKAENRHDNKQQQLDIKSIPQRQEMVECPVCGEFMTAEELQSEHIDLCLSGGTATKNKLSKSSRGCKSPKAFKTVEKKPQPAIKVDTSRNHQIQTKNNGKKLPKLDFSSFSTAKVKEKLSSVNISTAGSRQQMEARYNEYLNLYNANLDRLRPESEKSLRLKLSRWEHFNNIENGRNIFRELNKTDIPDNFSSQDWKASHSSQFGELIKKAREKMTRESTEEVEDVRSDCGGEGKSVVAEGEVTEGEVTEGQVTEGAIEPSNQSKDSSLKPSTGDAETPIDDFVEDSGDNFDEDFI